MQQSIEIIRYHIAEDTLQSFEESYAKAGAHLQASPYCLGYHILRGVDEPNNYVVTIYWTSKEDHLTGFRNSPQFADFFTLVKPFFNNIQEMTHYQDAGINWKREV